MFYDMAHHDVDAMNNDAKTVYVTALLKVIGSTRRGGGHHVS